MYAYLYQWGYNIMEYYINFFFRFVHVGQIFKGFRGLWFPQSFAWPTTTTQMTHTYC